MYNITQEIEREIAELEREREQLILYWFESRYFLNFIFLLQGFVARLLSIPLLTLYYSVTQAD